MKNIYCKFWGAYPKLVSLGNNNFMKICTFAGSEGHMLVGERCLSLRGGSRCLISPCFMIYFSCSMCICAAWVTLPPFLVFCSK